MLGKLLKFDLKYGFNVFMGIAGALLAAGVIVRIIDSPQVKELGMILLALGIIFPVSIISIAMIFQNFNKNLFGDHGYFTLTLPVRRGNVLASKLITSIIWFNFLMLMSGLAFAVIYSSGGFSFSNWLKDATISKLITDILIFAVLMNIIIIYFILKLFFCSSAANISVGGRRAGALFGGLAGFAYTAAEITLYVKLLNKILPEISLYTLMDNSLHIGKIPPGTGITNIVNVTVMLSFAAASAITYFIILHIIKKRVDLP